MCRNRVLCNLWHLAWSALPWLCWLACCALPRLGLPCLDQLQSRQGLAHHNNQPPSAAGGGCAAEVVVSKPLPLLELVKARQTEPRQGTASEPAEPRQSTPGEVAEPSQATLSARTTTQPPSAAGGGCAAAVVVSKPLVLLDLLEQVKTRQTEPRQGTASEPAEPRQSTPGPHSPISRMRAGGIEPRPWAAEPGDSPLGQAG